MADLKGILTQLNHALPTGVDPTRLAQWRLRDGVTYQQIRNRLATELTALNAELLQSWGDMIYITELDYLEYRNGGSIADMPDITDLDRAEATKASTIAHSIDLRVKGDGVGGSERFWRDARAAVIKANLDEKKQKGRQTIEKAILTRATNDGDNLVGSSGYDTAFANASATFSYTPPAYGGNTFDSTHTHFVGYNSASLDHGDMVNGLAKHVAEHGHTGMLKALVAEADIASYYALGDRFIQPTAGQTTIIDRGGQSSGVTSMFSNDDYGMRPPGGSYYVGKYLSDAGVVRVYGTARIPTGYAFVYNAYGINDERNSLAMRVHPTVGFGFYIKETPSEGTTYPIKHIQVEIEYGLSVNAGRTNGAAGYLVSGGVWVDPTIA